MKMSLSNSIFVLFFCLAINFVYSQTFVVVPDVQFQQFLTQNYPTADTIIGGTYYINADDPVIFNETSLDMQANLLTNLTGIEAFVNLEYLHFGTNNVSVLPSIPPNVTYLNCHGNNLTSLPTLPSGLITLITTSNTQLNVLPDLPNSIEVLTVVQSGLTYLPTLPSSLEALNCGHNNLTTLPTLPSGVSSIYCQGNNLTSLPPLPDGLMEFNCQNNQLTTLPALPQGLGILFISNNSISCLPTLPYGLYMWNFSNNPISCLPNYVPLMTSELNFPLCAENDPINNPSQCEPAQGVAGMVFNDTTNNCIDDFWRLKGVPLRLEDTQNNLLQMTQTSSIGSYMFSSAPYEYSVKVDTSALPNGVVVTCPESFDYSVITTTTNPLSSNNDFGLQCDGFDIAAIGGVPTGLVFPGQTHTLNILAGDVSNFANMRCAEGIPGEITIYVSGPSDTIVFTGTPIILSDTSATYSVADFGMQDLDSIFLYITTDTMATVTDSFRIYLSVSTPLPGDVHTQNDSIEFVYPCVNSYDPNKKVVYPQDVEVGYEDYFTYTIYFQNTGNAPAINIALRDGLDQNLDLNTFQMISASHDHTYTVNFPMRELVIRYPDIHLTDSTSDFEGSIGYFQYRIKPISNIPSGTVIENTAAIYFDFNAPIITNTTENLFYSLAGVKETSIGDELTSILKIYPNPSHDRIFLSSSKMISEVRILSLQGKLMFKEIVNTNLFSIPVIDFPNGLYLIQTVTDEFTSTTRFVKSDI